MVKRSTANGEYVKHTTTKKDERENVIRKANVFETRKFGEKRGNMEMEQDGRWNENTSRGVEKRQRTETATWENGDAHGMTEMC